MPKPVNSPFPKGVRGSEMPAFTAILAWVVADYGMTPEAARTFIVGCRGTESTIEPHQWQAKVHLALERKASMGKPEHWIHDTSAIALFNHVHCELDRREVVNAGRRGIVYASLAQNPITGYLGTVSDARAAFDAYIIDPANGFPLPPGPIQPPPEKPADENLAAQFPRHADGKRHWPDLDLDKWYPLDIKNAIVVNQPFDTERAAYEAYPKIRQQRGHDIEFGIGTHYKLVSPDKYTMPDYDGRNNQAIPPKEGEEVSTPHWIKDDKQRTAFWKDANNLCNKHKIGVDENGKIDIKGRRELVHETLNVEHMEEYMDTPDHAREELAVAFDELYPINDTPDQPPAQPASPKDAPADDPVKALWAELLPDFKTLRPDVTDKNQALEMILNVLGYKTMPEAYTEMGSDGVRKLWAEHKAELTQQAEEKTASGSPTAPAKTAEPARLDETAIREKYTLKMERNTKIKGKNGKPDQYKVVVTDYLQVAGRVLLFRLDNPKGRIETELLQITADGALFKASVIDGNGVLLSTSHAFATYANSDKFSGRVIEKAETSAIGRALAMAGYGTDQAGEDIDEADQLSDAPVEQRAAA